MVGISLVEVYDGLRRKSVNSVTNRPKMANRCILWMGKSWENVLVCDYIFNRQRIYSSYRDLKFFTRGTICQ